jgi:acyl-coenzyme A synthetase/AMP-(fatty) acid ligase
MSISLFTILEHTITQNAMFCLPHKVVCTDVIPKTVSGKILLRELKERERAQRPGQQGSASLS